MSLDIDAYDLIAPPHYGERGVPHDAWTTLREAAPVYRCEYGGEYQDFWAITKHADIMDISGKPEIFSNAPGITVMNRDQLAAMDNRANTPLGQM